MGGPLTALRRAGSARSRFGRRFRVTSRSTDTHLSVLLDQRALLEEIEWNTRTRGAVPHFEDDTYGA